MWVRGLKLMPYDYMLKIILSHPMWVRGLKQGIARRNVGVKLVAPYVGAWIETSSERPTNLRADCRTLCGCVD